LAVSTTIVPRICRISLDPDVRGRSQTDRPGLPRNCANYGSTSGPQKKFAMSEHYSFRCPLCDRRFIDDIARRRHLLDSTTCDAVEAILRLQFLLADRDEAVAVARRQRDEAREGVRGERWMA
jgi:hypothetical protein